MAAAHISRLNEALGVERAAAASALAALHGTIAAGAFAALHETLAAERQLAIERIIRLGAERAAAEGETAPARGSAVVRRVQHVSDAASIWAAISLLWHRDDGGRQLIRESAGSALILPPGNPDRFRGTGTELSSWRGPDAVAPRRSSRRRLMVNAFALLVAVVGVGVYGGRDIWSAATRQTPTGDVAAALPAAKPAAPANLPTPQVASLRDRAEAGDAAAQYALGVSYAQGDGVAQDYASAASWFKKAAGSGIVNAQDLASLYERGLIAPQDYVVAAYWYRNAAERGVAAAMQMLAVLYERGQGVEASPIEAYAWYRAAARRGDAEAGKRAAALFEQFGGPEKGRAVMRAAEIVDSLHEPRAAPAGSASLIPGDWVGNTTVK